MEEFEIFTQRMREGADLIGITFQGSVKEITRLDFYLKELEERVFECRRACREIMRAHQEPLPESMLVGVPTSAIASFLTTTPDVKEYCQ